MMTVTEVGCMPETTAIIRREFRGYDEVATAEVSTTARRYLPHAKRQNATSPISGSGLSPQAQLYLTQINTAIYTIDLINIGSNLGGTCQDLRNGVNDTQAATIAINVTQAADFVCAAYATNLTYIDPSLLQIFSAALYAVELAGNFTGTTNTTALCSSIDVDILTLPIFGVDGRAVQSYVCNANNVTLTTTFSTVTSTTNVTSAGTVTPIGWGNQTSFGTAPLATGPVVTGASTGTGSFGWPFSNYTGTRTITYTGPRTRSRSDHTQPTITRSPYSTLLGATAESGSAFDRPTGTDGSGSLYSSTAESGSGYNQPTGTDFSGWSYGGLTGFPTASGSGYAYPTGTGDAGWPYGNLTGLPIASGSGYAQPTGTGVSGLPYSNLTGFTTGSGSGYAQPTSTGGSEDPVGIRFSSHELPSSARLPPNPSTLHYYPAISPSKNPIVFYGYGYEG
jgi:hypothetical protein